jgi:hypothetical protein
VELLHEVVLADDDLHDPTFRCLSSGIYLWVERRDGVGMWIGSTGAERKGVGLCEKMWDGLGELRSDVDKSRCDEEESFLHIGAVCESP